MFFNNSNENKNITLEAQEPNKLIYLNSNAAEDEDDIDIRELFGILRRRSLIILGATITLATVFSTFILVKPRVYEGKFALLVESLNTSNMKLDFLSGFSDQKFNSGELDYESQISVLKSPLVMNPIIKEIESLYPEITKDDFIEKLNLRQVDKTKIIEVSYTDISTQKILFVLNKIKEGYLNYQEQEYYSNLSQTQFVTQDQIIRLQEDLSVLESQLESFQKSNNLIDPSITNSVLTQKNQFLVQQMNEIQIQLNAMTKLAEELGNKLNLTPEEGVIVSRLNQDQNFAKLISQIKEIETEISLERTRWGAQHPTIQILTAKKQELISLLNQESSKILGSKASNLSLDFLTSIPSDMQIIQQFFDTNNQIEALKAQQKVLNQALTEIDQDIDILPSQNKKYYQIQRKLKTANESFNRLLAVNENLQIEAAKKASPWKLLTPINESIIEDVSSKEKKIGLIVVASLFFSTLFGFLIDKLDSIFHSVEEIENTINLPPLGIIPYDKQLKLVTRKILDSSHDFNSKNELITNNDIALNLDAYMSLYTSINFLSSNSSMESIVIGAAGASEGKSTTSVFLAKAAAVMGKKVLIVDADIRKPKIHFYTGVKNTLGLSNLIEDNLALEQVIQTSDQENLFVISSGSKVPNPTKLISSPKMPALMKKLKQDFDFVIYDTPPLMGFSDAKIMTPFTDGLVFVVCLEQTRRSNVQRVINDLRISNVSVLGIVINGVKKSTHSYYDYSQYYEESIN